MNPFNGLKFSKCKSKQAGFVVSYVSNNLVWQDSSDS